MSPSFLGHKQGFALLNTYELANSQNPILKRSGFIFQPSFEGVKRLGFTYRLSCRANSANNNQRSFDRRLFAAVWCLLALAAIADHAILIYDLRIYAPRGIDHIP